MYQFFVEDHQVLEKEITILGEDVRHIRNVLRLKPGEQMRISSPDGDYFCELKDLDEGEVVARILYKDQESTELPVKITLFQGLPKGDKMEFIIQKAVELGAYEIVPVAMRNSVVKLDEKKAQAKAKRWQAIAESAAKQAKRSLIPTVHPPMKFSEAATYGESLDIVLLPYENERGMVHTKDIISSLKKEGNLGIFIGPEGGFDESEIQRMEGRAERISLGKRILRTETAGMALLSILLYQLEE